MSCLTDYIGLRGCEDVAPESGMYINSLPGMSLEFLEKIANAEQITYVGVWKDIQARAWLRFENDVKAKLAARYKIQNIYQSFDLGQRLEETTPTPAANVYRGISIDLRYGKKFVDSAFKKIDVQELSLYSAEEATVEGVSIKFFDLDTRQLLKTIVQDIVQGWNKIPVNTTLSSKGLFIGYDATSIAGSELLTNDYAGCCDWEGNVRGAEMTGNNVTGIVLGSNSFGLSAIIYVGCSYDALICSNKSSFTSSWLYLLGVEATVQNLTSTRTNKSTLNKEPLEEMVGYYEKEYEKQLTQAIAGTNISLSDACIECNQQYTVQTSLP